MNIKECLLFTLLFSLLFSLPMQAAQFVPLKDAAILVEAGGKKEYFDQVTSASSVIVDEDLIKQDFPQTRKLSSGQIKSWFVKNAAVISRQQSSQDVVNSPIPTSGETQEIVRPNEYRRGAVIIVPGGGMLDVKGSGSVNPDPGEYGNGLLPLGDAIREFIYEKLVKKIFAHSQADFSTVGCYGVIDYGFKIKIHGGNGEITYIPAGLVARQAHQRYYGPRPTDHRGWASVLPAETAVAVEKILRAYGITSAGANRDGDVDLLNVQGDIGKKAIVDFGAFLAVQDFEKPVRHIYGQDILLDPNSPQFPQPNPKIRVPFDVWGYTATGKADPAYDNPSIYSNQLAEDLHRGVAQPEHAYLHLKTMLSMIQSRLAENPIRPAKLMCNRLFQ